MGEKYSSILVGGVVQTYNDNPPPDDGSQTEANRVKFATITSDLTAPLHSAIVDMDGKIETLVDEGPDGKSSNYTTVAGDYATVMECTGTITVSLLNPTGNTGYKVSVKNAGSGTITVDVDGGANVDGASSVDLGPGVCNEFRVNEAGTAYYSTSSTGDGFVSGTVMLFYQELAPTGWTIITNVDDHAVVLTKSGGVNGSPLGGTRGGTHNFFDTFSILSESATPGVGDHQLTEAEMPAHTHVEGYDDDGNQGGGGTFKAGAPGTPAPVVNTGSTGGDGTHSHTINIEVKWAAVIVASKD